MNISEIFTKEALTPAEDKLIDLISNRSKMKNIGEYNYNFANEKLLNAIVAKRISAYIKKVIDDN